MTHPIKTALAMQKTAKITANISSIIKNREDTTLALKNLGFECLDSKTNFIFAKSDRISGEELYLKLRERGILVRHFTRERIKDYNRITIGSREQMEALSLALREIMEET